MSIMNKNTIVTGIITLLFSAESAEVCNRISCYISGACHVVQLPIGEAMITYKEKLSEEESSQIFVPFINVSSPQES